MMRPRIYAVALPAFLVAFLGLALALDCAHSAAGFTLSALIGFVACDALISSEVKP